MQRLRRLVRQRTTRRSDGAFVAEGVKVLGAALDARAPVEAVYYSSEAAGAPGALDVVERAREGGVRVFALQRGVVERVADAVSPQPVLGVVGNVDRPLREVLARAPSGAPLVVCVDVRDPGNLGAIVRVADAAGACGVVCCDTCADVFNPKAVRASAGSLFHVPVVVDVGAADVLRVLRDAGYRCVAAVAHGGEDYAAAELGDRVALVLGNEAHGLDDVLLAALDARVSIPMAGGAESLNVAIAAAVVSFELARRHRLGPGGSDAGTGGPAGGAPGGVVRSGGEPSADEPVR